MDKWLKAALDHVPDWLAYQVRQSEQPGCAVAIAHKGKVIFEQAYGHADAIRGVELTPRHRFRVASHSKSFTAAGAHHGETVRRVRNGRNKVTEVWMAGNKFLPEAKVAQEISKRYGG